MDSDTIDLRSDTVTRPTPAMRVAIANAQVGDDVLGDDPTVQRLEQQTAEILGKQAAVYMPSGTMTNQVAVRIHCKPGDEFICEAACHIYNSEQGGFAQLSGVVGRPVDGKSGILDPAQLESLLRPDDVHCVRTRLVCLENTHAHSGGRVQPYDVVEQICRWAHDHGLRTHMDGARLFNAVAATQIGAERWCEHFDTVSVCFSKGLGAPVGSALAGSAGAIDEARRHRKLFGGGMRQVGIIAAGALYALEHQRDRLAEDHAHARIIARAIAQSPGLQLVGDNVETNILIFAVDRAVGDAGSFAGALDPHGVLCLPVGADLVRMVTHLDISEADARRTAAIIKRVAKSMAPALAGT